MKPTEPDNLPALSSQRTPAPTIDILSLSSSGLPSPRMLLSTKLHVPRPRPDAVSRPRLVSLLNSRLDRPLTLICAPAGSGKSTLLAEWAATWRTPLGWLSLDSGDSEPARFWAYFVAALETAAPALGESARLVLQSSGLDPIEPFLDALMNEVTLEQRPITLVLDDYHTIESDQIHEGIRYLLDHLGERTEAGEGQCALRLVIASRSLPPLPVARLRVRAQLSEVNAPAMAFSTGEVTEFFRAVGLRGLSEHDMAVLLDKTEGWAAGLRLAALALEGHADASGFISSLTGSHRLIADYLTDELLRHQPPHVQELLLKTSILQRFCAPLCDAVLGQSSSGSQTVLEYLERSNLFVVALDNERHWYRYHHLLAELMRDRLDRAEPALVPELYVRASCWYEEHGLTQEAVEMALAAEDTERAARLVEAACDQVAMSSEMAVLQKWIEALPRGLVEARPRLCLAKAWSLIPREHLDEAETWLRHAEQCVYEGAGCEGVVESAREVLGEVAAVRAVIATVEYNVPRIIACSRAALELVPAERYYLRGLTNLGLGVAYAITGDLSAARQVLTEAVNLRSTAGNVLLTYLGLYHLANVANREGKLHEAAAFAQDALALARTTSGAELPIAGLAHITLAGLAYEWNDLDRAMAHVERGLELSKGWWVRDAVLEAYYTLARIRQALQDREGALSAHRRGYALAASHHARPFITHESIPNLRAWYRAGSLQDGLDWAQNLQQLTQAQGGLDPSRLWEAPAAAHLLFAAGRIEQAARLLAPLLEAVEQRGFNRQVVEVLVLRAILSSSKGDRGEAMIALVRALLLAEPEGYIRIFVDEGPAMRELLEQARTRGIAHGYVNRLLAAFGAEPRQGSPVAAPLVEPLSGRELEVLQLVAAGLSSREIADRLVITPGTAKNHVKSIYGKLAVHSRVQAVQRARELGLL